MLNIPRFPWQLYLDILRFPWQLYLQYTPPKKEKIDGLIMSSESNNFFTKVRKAPIETKRIHLFSSLRIEIVINPEKTIHFDSANGRFPYKAY